MNAAITILIGLSAIMYFTMDSTSQVSSDPLESAFMGFVAEHGKVYTSKEEYEFRFGLYKKNVDWIAQENKKGYSHKLGMNHFGDWTDAEFKKTLGMKNAERAVKTEEDLSTYSVPSEFDWADIGDGTAIHEIVDQGACGSCWAFAAAGAYETLYWKHHDQTQFDFSEQQLVDCSRAYYNEGCDGGELSYAYNYLHDYKFTILNNYPYHAADEVCKYQDVLYRPGEEIEKFVEFNNTNVDGLKSMVTTNPVSVALEAQNWKFYESGVFDASACGEDIDHGVVVVGYNTTGNYWRLKNSWSKRWGEDGYMKLAIETEEDFVDGSCGIQNRPSYPNF